MPTERIETKKREIPEVRKFNEIFYRRFGKTMLSKRDAIIKARRLKRNGNLVRMIEYKRHAIQGKSYILFVAY